MNKDILILGWCDVDEVINYGQILQGCAMMYLIRKYTDGKIIYASYLPRNMRGKIRWLRKHCNIFNGHFNAYFKTRKILNSFIKTNTITFHYVSDDNKLEKLAKNIKIMICGSDQIWHPYNYNKNYYLDFGLNNAIRISYAASFPKSYIEPQFKENIKIMSKNIRKFSFVSVREEDSVSLITALTCKNVCHVLDPTYMVPNALWDSYVEDMNLTKMYIFVYIPNGMDQNLVNYIKKVKEILKVEEVIILMTRGENIFDFGKIMQFISLGQFLYLIKNAQCVITSSFHAVVFSTIFHTDFLCYDVPNKARGEDLRLIDLLEIFNLKNRNLNLIEDIGNLKHIQYKNFDKLKEKYVKQSFDFLNEAFVKESEKEISEYEQEK